jgi:tetratricopeptide (TPR) repeat protein
MTLVLFRNRFLCAIFAALLSGCALPTSNDGAQSAGSDAAEHPAAPPKPQLPPQELTQDLLYDYLVAEMAVHRQQYALAAKAYVELARRTRDPRIARRATDIAVYARQPALAVEAATLWLQAEPASLPARQTLASIFVSSGALQDIRPHLEMLLATDPNRTAQVFLQVNQMLARHTDKAAVATLVQDLARLYPRIAEGHLAAAQASWNANLIDAALDAIRMALKLRPDWELAALFQAQVLQHRSAAEGLTYYRAYLKDYPAAKDMRLNFARLLLVERKTEEARRELRVLSESEPQNPDIALTIGLLAVQMSDWPLAEVHLKRALDLNSGRADTVRYYLGQISEERKRPDDALTWYQEVARGEQYIPAQSRIAGILAKKGQVSEARNLLQAIEPQTLQQRVQLTQAEASVLREATAYKDAFDLLAQAVEKLPNVPELLYDFAMAAEKVDRIDVLETNLRKLIEMRPDHAHALNALGYTLADRTDRLQEAYQLIDQALKLAPDDPFIQDSMGWVLYRLGRVDEGRVYLERAFKARPDPEIAAHLGEILWVQGKRDEARRIWNETLKEHPGNEVLQGVIKKHAQ